MEVQFLTRDAATIETDLGPMRLALRSYRWKRGPMFDNVVWLGFDEEDQKRSRPVLQQSRSLAFELWTDGSIHEDFCIYLGQDLSIWDPDLVIHLPLKVLGDSGTGWNQWWAEPSDEDVKRIKTSYWCAAKAHVTVCRDTQVPVHRVDGQALQTSVELGYDESYSGLYEDVLADLSRLNLQGHLAAPFEQYLDYLKEQRERAEGLQAYELYKRLKGMLPRYETALRQVIIAPATQLVPTLRHHALTPTQAGVLLRERSGMMDVTHVLEAVPVSGRPVPTIFTAVQPARTERTTANQFVAQSVRRIQALLEFVERHLRSEEARSMPNPHHQAALGELAQDQIRFKRYGEQLPQPAVAVNVAAVSATSAVLYYDHRYATLRRLTDLVDRILSYVDTTAIPNAIQAFNRLYEHWCFIQVVEALLKLDFVFVQREGRRKTDFYWHPVRGEVNCELTHPTLPEVILEIWYERKYPKLKRPTDYYDPNRPYGLEKRGWQYSRYSGWKDCPDIALEFHDRSQGDPPKIVTLDPTLRAPRPQPTDPNDPHEDKYDYQEAIRSFKNRDPNTGESLRIVQAAWGISPWGRRKTDGSEPYTLEHKNDFQRGFIHLRPDTDSRDSLPRTLKTILTSVNILPSTESISSGYESNS